MTRVSYYRSIFLFGPTLPGTNFNQQAGVQGFNDTTSIFAFLRSQSAGYATFTGSPSDQRPKSNRMRELAVCGQPELLERPAIMSKSAPS